MGWGNCGTDSKDRQIGYLFEATCDHKGCRKQINRGLSYACGGMHGIDPAESCEGYFCGAHMVHSWSVDSQSYHQFCIGCAARIDEQRVEDYRDLLMSTLPRDPAEALSFTLVAPHVMRVLRKGVGIGDIRMYGTKMGATDDTIVKRWEFCGFQGQTRIGLGAEGLVAAVARLTEILSPGPPEPEEYARRVAKLLVQWDDERIDDLPLDENILGPYEMKRVREAKERQAGYKAGIAQARLAANG